MSEYHSECDRLIYTRIPYVGRLPNDGWQNGHSIHFDAHKSLGSDAANAMRDRVKACLDACAGIEDPAEALEKARQILRNLAAHAGCPNVTESWMGKQAAKALRALGG